jgi:PadR family transcriptional regulator, regulatory protein PadR
MRMPFGRSPSRGPNVSMYNKAMTGIERVTNQLLQLIFVLLEAYSQNEELHGYEIKKRAGLTGPSTYRGLDRLEDANLIEARWEELREGEHRPRRCYYRLNAEGAATARKLLAERHPGALQRLGGTRSWRAPAPTPRFNTHFGTIENLVGECG